MELPRHNPFIKGIYLFAVLFMFLFMALVIKSYWPNDQQMSHWNDELLVPLSERQSTQSTGITKPTLGLTAQSNAADDHQEKNDQLELHARAKKIVIGLPFTLRLKDDMETQLNHIWRQFYNNDQLHKDLNIKNKSKVMMVYQHFNADQSNINIVIGYTAKNNGQSADFSLVEIPAGNFLKAHSVLEVWNKPPKVSGVINYQNDYESYLLDRDFNVISQTAYVRVTQ